MIPCCDRCGRWNHFRPTCRETTNVNGISLDRTMCSKCGNYGHHRRVCWRKVAPAAWCTRCARYGHSESECRSRHSLYGTDLWDISRCPRCWRYGHNERGCRQVRTVFGDELGRQPSRSGNNRLRSRGGRDRSDRKRQLSDRSDRGSRQCRGKHRSRSTAGGRNRNDGGSGLPCVL